MIDITYPDYTVVHLDTFFVNTDIDFDLYNRNPETKRFVLFSSAYTQFTEEHKKSLISNKTPALYITPEDFEKYIRYIERHLGRIIESDRLKIADKTKFVFECSKHLMSDTVKNPLERQNYVQAQAFIKNTAKFILFERNYFPRFREIIEKDFELSLHQTNVCIYSLALAAKLGQNSFDSLETLGVSALLHDIGMVNLPPKVLFKSESLDNNEWDMVKKHPDEGVSILKTHAGFSQNILDTIRFHHEKLDGSGYPKGLTREQIPYSAKILAVADIFDAINSERPYRPAIDTLQTFEIMMREFEGKIDFNILKELVVLLGRRG